MFQEIHKFREIEVNLFREFLQVHVGNCLNRKPFL